MVDLLLIGGLGLIILVAGMTVFGVILNILTSPNISRKIDEKMREAGFDIPEYSDEDWTL